MTAMFSLDHHQVVPPTCTGLPGKFDYILLETTGLADPAPVAAMFWLDEELGAQVVVVLVLVLMCERVARCTWTG